MITSTIRKAAVATASLALGVAGTALGVHHASAAPSPEVRQLAASCIETTDGRACVGLNEVMSSPHPPLQAVFTLTPKAGHVMRPVTWQPVNPGFFVGDRSLCSKTCGVVTKPWVQTVGNISVTSVIRFTFYTPGHSYTISAGNGAFQANSSDGRGFSLSETTTYVSVGNVIHTTTRASYSLVSRYSQSGSVRIFDSLNHTLAQGELCNSVKDSYCTGHPTSLYATGVYGQSNGPSQAQGAAARVLVAPVNQYESLTAENKEFATH